MRGKEKRIIFCFLRSFISSLSPSPPLTRICSLKPPNSLPDRRAFTIFLLLLRSFFLASSQRVREAAAKKKPDFPFMTFLLPCTFLFFFPPLLFNSAKQTFHTWQAQRRAAGEREGNRKREKRERKESEKTDAEREMIRNPNLPDREHKQTDSQRNRFPSDILRQLSRQRK